MAECFLKRAETLEKEEVLVLMLGLFGKELKTNPVVGILVICCLQPFSNLMSKDVLECNQQCNQYFLFFQRHIPISHYSRLHSLSRGRSPYIYLCCFVVIKSKLCVMILTIICNDQNKFKKKQFIFIVYKNIFL